MDSWHRAYKNPKWFAKRKIILKRDGEQCTVCGKKTNLIVHHTFYYKEQSNPWDYPDNSLLTLCNDCHKNWHLHHELEYRNKPQDKDLSNGGYRKKKKAIKQKKYKTLSAKIDALDKEKEKKRRWDECHITIEGKTYRI